jgi:hypothetical protein
MLHTPDPYPYTRTANVYKPQFPNSANNYNYLSFNIRSQFLTVIHGVTYESS